jgi:arginase
MDYRYLIYPLELGTGKSTTIPGSVGEYIDLLGNRPMLLQPAPRSVECRDDATQALKYHAELVSSLQSAQAAVRSFQLNALVGGDCSSDFALVPVMRERFPDLAVIWIDTHADLNSPHSTPSRHFHGMVLRSLLGDSSDALNALNPQPIAPEKLIYVGLRETDPAEAEHIRAKAIPVLRVAQLEHDPHALADYVVSKDLRHVHVHLDVDVLDAREFRSTGFASEGGLRVATLFKALHRLREASILVSFAITEYAPCGAPGEHEVIRALWQALSGETAKQNR